MLRDLSCPSGQFLSLLFPAGIIVFHFDFLISGCLANSFQGQTSFLRLISSPSGNDHRIKHHHIDQAHVHDNNIFLHTDHILPPCPHRPPDSPARYPADLFQPKDPPALPAPRAVLKENISYNLFYHFATPQTLSHVS